MRLRLLLLLVPLLAGGLLSLGVPLARGIAADEARSLQLDRLQDAVRFASLAQPSTEVPGDQVARDVLSAQLERYTQLYDVEVALLDPAGQTYLGQLSSTGSGGLSPHVRPAAAAALSGRVGEGPQWLWPWDDDPFVVAQPVVSDGDVVGAVVSVSAAASARSRVLAGWALLAAAGLIALLVATVLAARLASWVLRPIRLLENAAHSIAGGDFGTRVSGAAGPPELRHLAGVFNDMADRVQTVLAAQRTFVADASHQLRNPLNALLLRLEALTPTHLTPTHQTPANQQAATDRATAARLAVREGRNLAATLDRMLELARAEHATAAPAPVDVAAVVDDRLTSWSVLAGRRSIVLRREGAASAIGWQDAVALSGAVDAVVDNALKFSPEGGVVTVLVHRRPDGWVRIAVTDAGPGMSAAELAKAPERFWRSDDGPRATGSGLGLSIASELLERHGGRLEVQQGPQGHGVCAQLLVAPAGQAGISA
jgi:signal transduction histidine kinase